LERNVLNESDKRLSSMRRNESLEMLLAELNSVLAPASACLSVSRDDRLAKVFVVGPMRAGTTLYMQWLASTGLVSYPTNLLSRFYGAPLIGAKIQQMLTDPTFDFRNEILDFSSKVGFYSENGKTVGALAPNEFWYFWRRFLPALADGYCDSDELRRTSDLIRLREEINGLSNIFGRPFAMKALILNQHVELLIESFARPIIVWVQRDPIFNMQSALLARARQYGTMAAWYSFKIREYPWLRDMDPLRSVAGQIHAINAGIERSLANISPANKIVVHYEEFCANPGAAYDLLSSKLAAQDSLISSAPYNGVSSFQNSNRWEIDDYSLSEAERAFGEVRGLMGTSS